jgi:hypothetical protein
VPAPAALAPSPAPIPFTPLAVRAKSEPADASVAGGTSKPRTNSQKLAKALKSCRA